MRTVVPFLISCCFLIAPVTFAQDEDTTFVPPPADTSHQLPQDTDTLILPDTLTEAQKALVQFEEKRKEFQEEQIERKPRLSLFDSLSTYFLSQRLNQRSSIEQSYFRDAGDYFHFDPSFFVLDYDSSPVRKTVQPFGLSGNRLNVISNEMPLEPFEHFIEPDGQMDLNDIPTAGDDHRYVVPGAAGLLFGGNHAFASLVTSPRQPDSLTPQSAFLVDQGSFEYNYVRGKYSKLFSAGREIDLSIGYRNADGDGSFRNDDVYHYAGRFFQPLGLNSGINASGHLYDREGKYVVARHFPTGIRITPFTRQRIDRSAELSFEHHNDTHDARSLAGYRHLRQGSHVQGTYRGAFDYSGWGLFVSREWMSGNSLLKIEANSDNLNYNNGYDDFVRDQGEVLASYVRLDSGTRYAFTAGAKYIDGFDLLPTGAAVLTIDKPRLYMLFSAGYTERAPSLHELHLRFQRAYVYSDNVRDYADQGNGNLQKEKQLVASGLVEVGGKATNIRLTLTGGKIKDGIDWFNDLVVEPLEGPYTLFTPVNGDIDFVDASVQQNLRLNDFLRLRSGGAYRDVTYEIVSKKPYLPDYQFFSGLELRYYWPQKIMDLYAYGELNYASEYDGYDIEGLGNEVIANVKLSFRIKDFRFHYVIQNALQNLYEPREAMFYPGRYSYFGLVWRFHD